jgi:hypothetical protein
MRCIPQMHRARSTKDLDILADRGNAGDVRVNSKESPGWLILNFFSPVAVFAFEGREISHSTTSYCCILCVCVCVEVLQPFNNTEKCLRNSLRNSFELTKQEAGPIPWTQSLNFTARTRGNVFGPLLASSLPTQVFPRPRIVRGSLAVYRCHCTLFLLRFVRVGRLRSARCLWALSCGVYVRVRACVSTQLEFTRTHLESTRIALN